MSVFFKIYLPTIIFLLCIFVDRHNDLAYQLRDIFKNQLSEIDLLKNTSGQYGAVWQTDIPRLRAGHLGGQVSMDLYSQVITLGVHFNISHI